MGERLLCKQEVGGSIPLTSTRCGIHAANARAIRGGSEKQNGLRRRRGSRAPVFDTVKREYPKRQTPDMRPRVGGFGRMKSVFTRDSSLRGFALQATGFAIKRKEKGIWWMPWH